MDILQKKNEAEVNENVAKGLIAVFGLVLIFSIFCWFKIFDIYYEMVILILGIAFFTLLAPAIAVLLFHCYNGWMKYFIIAGSVITVSSAYAIFTFQAVIIFLVPTLIAALYRERRVLCFSGILSMAGIILSHVFTGIYLYQPEIEPFKDMASIIRYGATPRCLQYLLCFYLIYMIVTRNIVNQKNSVGEIQMRENINKENPENGVDLKKLNGLADIEGLESKERREFTSLLTKLSDREQEVFLLLLCGYTNLQIANKLYLSNGTVKNYVSTIYEKLETKERNTLIMKYSGFAASYDRSHIQK